jgi:hypothetical protein
MSDRKSLKLANLIDYYLFMNLKYSHQMYIFIKRMMQ